MKNYKQVGEVIDVVLAAIVASGAGRLFGQMFGVAQKAGAIGDTVGFAVEGVFELPYGVAATAALGDLIYWDDTAKAVTKTASSNKKIGYCAQMTVAASDPTMLVRLVPNI